ncbi:hypothetical protein BT93_C2037 [Corymbia citriodora subsp. variegata]|nr:hypothetical protein BT93_C2037 [Corymbia citriodora subsp. variegata]
MANFAKESTFSPILPLLYIVLQVLISGKEEPEAPLSLAFCSIRFLVASIQAINLIGKQGSLIRSIQEGTGASVRVLPEGIMWMHSIEDLYAFC